MQIVIDIPKEIFEEIKATKTICWTGASVLCSAIVNGKPIPKGHGRLIDADTLPNMQLTMHQQSLNQMR